MHFPLNSRVVCIYLPRYLRFFSCMSARALVVLFGMCHAAYPLPMYLSVPLPASLSSDL